jgi:tRNA-specific 2-thiouridylase
MWNLKHLLNMITKPGRNKRVFVGVSGGVDSSVTALLLKLYGYDVTGVFIKTWQPEWIDCTWRDERRDAMRVCAHLEIPFIELDLEQEYKQGVVDYMITEYKLGRTPNPDVMCNREVKFGGFLNWALEQNADYVATGHYAQNINNQLCKGIDESKDQSYFVWTLTNDQLKHILFPVGNLQKKQVRKLAKRYNVPVATKKDSQGICFIGDIDMKDFLSHYIDKQPGNVINTEGEIIGTHDGVLFYTLGERHGFVIDKKTTHDKPYYVIAKDLEHNLLTVSQNLMVNKKQESITLVNCVWRIQPQPEKSYKAQVRYHGEFKDCVITRENNSEIVSFNETDMTISSGQSVVVYDNTICIGGGIVE